LGRRVIFRVHAIQRMFKRGIREEEVIAVLQRGETIEEYPEDSPYPSRLMLGWQGTRPLHVVVAENSPDQENIVITAYEPDSEIWEEGFRRKKL
jgi:hypothetical protein